ncbi:MAG: orotate phosphoribosyltransferase [Aigarchaeota archaeon]|nr:orotate phosphoribosyltransferase [Aigarchaeota archaeon]MDW7985624.1 orotate phosphoribosyltransferase [Nitrososphaerota archaeon]
MISRVLWKIEVVKFGEFKLSSGKTSNIYIDLRKLPSHPNVFKYVVTELVKKISGEAFDIICGIATGGLPIAVAVAYEMRRPMIYVRKEKKEHGAERLIEGDWEEDSRVLLIDDVSTTGSSLMMATEVLREHGLRVEKAWVVVDRLEGAREALASIGVKLQSLITLKDLLSTEEWSHEVPKLG